MLNNQKIRKYTYILEIERGTREDVENEGQNNFSVDGSNKNRDSRAGKVVPTDFSTAP